MSAPAPTATTARVPFAGDPHDLVEPLAELFGPLFCYRLPGRERRTLLASLADVWRITTDGIERGGERFDGDVAALLDHLLAEARRGPGADVAFALSYDLSLRLRAEAGIPGGPWPTAAPGRLLGFAGPLRRAVVHDPATGTLSCAEEDRADVMSACARTAARAAPPPTAPLTEVVTDIDPHRYADQLARAREHLLAGDIYQVVLSVPVRVRPRTSLPRYYADVAHRYATADYSYWFSLDGATVFGNCSLPHVLARDGRVRSRVFAGTQPAARDERERQERGALLRDDPKYFAEHIMLVDLERNDLGSYCEPGTVVVDRLCEPLVIGPTTYLASDVSGAYDTARGLGGVVLASFPRGVVVGAPKLRAQEVLADLEGEPRGFFAGAVGIYDAARDALTSNTIVTCAERDGPDVLLRCGGGVVAGSDVTQELAELDLKLRYLR
ncbi:chorismate-binding protein [Micromonospora sp. WMMD975]|uniref:chorismate-binding protein n=1 Tax=Micromonospora sp. WMMD975 TaxID=3016087 RepID=UPI00249C5429|nr:chorismate-binding protein [Micromonospora sp. WMMD975]WFE36559.1 chorismate-binding protein [Micromonospora sp. WMMD975]